MKSVSVFFFLIQSVSLSAQSVIYVNQNVSGGQNTGISWTDAFTNLQNALGIAAYGDVIWVAKGTYLPTTSTNRSISFVLKNGVKIYGGFLGGETNINQRDFELNETKLSGEIGSFSTLDNTYNVVYGEGLDSTTVLDGFVIEKGNALGSTQSKGAGACIRASSNVINTCPLIQNIKFANNRASIGGGLAIVREVGDENYVNPEVRNCQFILNRASLYGGGMAKIGPSFAEHPFLVDRCVFKGNKSTLEGGGVYISSAEYNFIFNKCVFEKDTSTSSLGGGFYFASGYEEFAGANLLLDSCEFVENTATEGGGFYYRDGGISSFSIPPFNATLTNCSFKQNIATNGYGGAFGFTGYDKSVFTVNLAGCAFYNNLTHANYNSFFHADEGSNCKVRIKDCRYFGNKDLEDPDKFCFPISLAIGGIASRMEARIENCLFVDNGGGVSSLCTLNGGGINTYISNCTFFDNNEILFNKSYYSTFNGLDHFANTYLNNCIIWQPGASIWNLFNDNDFTINKLEGYQADYCLLSQDSLITNIYSVFGSHNISETDPLFLNVVNGDFRLESCSPAVNAGNSIIVDTMGITTDIDGLPRVQFSNVDIGAHETQDSCISINAFEPKTDKLIVLLSPNPVSKGELFKIEVLGTKQLKPGWNLFDNMGRSISAGEEIPGDNHYLTIQAPASPGTYLVKLHSTLQIIWLKLIVF